MLLRRVAITLTAVLAMLEVASAANAETISEYWDDVALAYIHQTGSIPQTTARMMAVMHAAMYDAWTAYDPTAVPTRSNGILKRPPEENTDPNKIEAISFAAHKALVALLPSMSTGIDIALAELGYSLGDAANADTSTPQGIGNVAAEGAIAFYHFELPRYVAISKPDPNDDPNAWRQVQPSDAGLIAERESRGSLNQ